MRKVYLPLFILIFCSTAMQCQSNKSKAEDSNNFEKQTIPRDFGKVDFVTVSKNVTGAVVNIQSTQSLQASERERQEEIERYRRYFDEDFFRYFFGPETPREPRQKMGIGSGVIIRDDGYIVTNNHVVSNASDIDVTLFDNRTFKAKIVGFDLSTDLAIIKIDEKNLPVVSIANSDDVQTGEWVLAVGNPYGLTSTVTAGIVSAKSRSLNILSERNAIESFIQTDAAINPGNSGGALVNVNGELIGINTAIASPTGTFSGYGFAVSSNLVKKVVNDIIEHGTVQRGYLGILMRNITGKFANEMKLKINQGAYVDSVMAESAAAKAGIRPGDIIVAVNGRKIIQTSELQEMVAVRKPGDKLEIVVNRNGETKTFNPTLKELSKSQDLASSGQQDGNPETMLGAGLRDIDKNLAQKLAIEGGVQVTKIRQGVLSNTGMRDGFIITKVNDKVIRNIKELNSELQKRKGSGVMLEGVYENVTGKFYYAFGL